mmetsp:Transcript_39202/g.62801  ORF Transcript_39202/g.62801 Transcript_39202/m.62801 type:complete len:89 (+) Transcript_39202:116-382(+)
MIGILWRGRRALRVLCDDYFPSASCVQLPRLTLLRSTFLGVIFRDRLAPPAMVRVGRGREYVGLNGQPPLSSAAAAAATLLHSAATAR